MRTAHLAAALVLPSFAVPVFAQPSVTPLVSIRPEAISGDGRVVVGSRTALPSGHAAYWTRNGPQIDLGIPAGFDAAKVVSTNWDGSVLSIIATASGGHAASWVWTQATGMIPLTLPGMINLQASCVSRDGTVLAGAAVNPATAQYLAFRWSFAEGGLAVPQGSNYSSWIHALSQSGLSAAGSGASSQGTWAMHWPSTYSWCETLGSVPGTTGAIAYGMSPDASTIVGRFIMPGSIAGKALVWNASDGLTSVDPIPGYINASLLAVSDDGLLAGGYLSNTLGEDGDAIVWRRGAGLFLAQDYFAARGITTGSLGRIVGVSASGRVICARNALIDLGPCGSADFNHDGASGTDADIEAFFACLAGDCCPLCDSVDFNNDGDAATDADIEAFFRVLAGGSC